MNPNFNSFKEYLGQTKFNLKTCIWHKPQIFIKTEALNMVVKGTFLSFIDFIMSFFRFGLKMCFPRTYIVHFFFLFLHTNVLDEFL